MRWVFYEFNFLDMAGRWTVDLITKNDLKFSQQAHVSFSRAVQTPATRVGTTLDPPAWRLPSGPNITGHVESGVRSLQRFLIG